MDTAIHVDSLFSIQTLWATVAVASVPCRYTILERPHSEQQAPLHGIGDATNKPTCSSLQRSFPVPAATVQQWLPESEVLNGLDATELFSAIFRPSRHTVNHQGSILPAQVSGRHTAAYALQVQTQR